jgi:2-(1,2-epoxy-1,2-dihydrophenyl)acetyl-CoA isomerase
MPYEALILDIRDHIATITLNRPDAYNAVNAQMAGECLEALTQVDEDPTVRCVVITGAGRAFSAGGDVRGFHDHLPEIGTHLKQLTHLLHGAVSRIARMPKPVIAAVNGVVAGGGMGLLLACDLAYAVETATLSMAYTRIGANPNGSSTFWLPRLVGVRRALELIYTNRILSAQEALAWGILNGVVAPERFPAEVFAAARQIAQGPTLAYARAIALSHCFSASCSQRSQRTLPTDGRSRLPFGTIAQWPHINVRCQRGRPSSLPTSCPWLIQLMWLMRLSPFSHVISLASWPLALCGSGFLVQQRSPWWIFLRPGSPRPCWRLGVSGAREVVSDTSRRFAASAGCP